MLPAFPNVTTQIDTDNNDVDLDDLKSSVLSNKQVMLKWIQTTEKQLEDEIALTKTKILTESKKEINYVDEILKEKLTITSERARTKETTRMRCSFVGESGESGECRRASQPYSNRCSEHIFQNSDQSLFKQRCSFILSNSQPCPNLALPADDKEKSQFCQRHLKLIKKRNQNGEKDRKDGKETTSKPKRKYVKTNGTTNENKPRKPRKKKDAVGLSNGDNPVSSNGVSANGLPNNAISQEIVDQQRPNSGSLTDNLTDSNFNKSQQQQQQRSFTPFVNSTAPNACYSTDLNDNSAAQYGYTTIATADHHGLIATTDHHYAPCMAAGLNSNGTLNGNTNLNNNLNQLSNLGHSEDSLTLAIAGNADDLASVPFEESELTEMLGKMGKIPEDAFNDILMENLSTESSELRAIDNIAFNSDNLDNLEPSISGQAFASLNFKSGSNGFFSQVSADQQNGLMNNGNLIYNNNNLSNLNGPLNLDSLNGGVGGGELICLPNDLISTSQPIKEMGVQSHHFAIAGSMPGSGSSASDPQSNYGGSFGVLDYKQPQQIQPYASNVIHQSTYANGGNFSSSYLHPNVSNYSPAMNGHLLSDNTQNGLLSNGHSNQLLNNGYSNSSSLSNSLPSNLSVSGNLAPPSGLSSGSSSDQLPPASQGSYCAPTVKNDDKKFNLFTNCKTNGSALYPSTYSNIYDDLPVFSESNRVNGSSSLPSFSLMKKNRIESR